MWWEGKSLTELSLTGDVLVQLAVFFIIIPIFILVAFIVITRAVEGREMEQESGLSAWYLALVIPLAFIGLVALNLDNDYLVIIAASLAQSIPITIGTFKYYELKTNIEKNKRDSEIDDLCGRIEDIEGKLGIMLPYSPYRVRKKL
jgi:hypothetical protein